MPIVRTFSALFLTALFAAPAAAGDLRLEDFFKGRTTATGSFRAITGLKREFDVVLHGRWDGRTLILREDFRYDDGERDTKTWRFVKTGPNSYTGTREDVLGETKVTLAGNEAHFNYRVDLDPAFRHVGFAVSVGLRCCRLTTTGNAQRRQGGENSFHRACLPLAPVRPQAGPVAAQHTI